MVLIEPSRGDLRSVASNPAINILSFSVLATAAATAPRGAYLTLALIAGFSVAVTHLRGAGVFALFKRSLVVLPFILMALVFTPFIDSPAQDGYYNVGPVRLSKPGVEIAINAALKSWTAVVCVLALNMTTGFNHILEGLSSLRFPSSFVTSMAFAYRYMESLFDDTMRMRRAMLMRDYGGRWLWRAGALGGLVGALFLRSLSRAERIHQAAVSRGFDGRFHGRQHARPVVSDYIFFGASLAMAVLSRALG